MPVQEWGKTCLCFGTKWVGPQAPPQLLCPTGGGGARPGPPQLGQCGAGGHCPPTSSPFLLPLPLTMALSLLGRVARDSSGPVGGMGTPGAGPRDFGGG